MTRDEIYDHLAQVYLGKRKKADEEKKKQFNAWLLINIFITIIIFTSAYYGLTAFLAQRKTTLQNSIIFSLTNGPVRLEYDFRDDAHPIEALILSVPSMDAAKFKKINFSLRARDNSSPGMVKIILKNKRNETAFYYVQGVNAAWQKYSVPLKDFQQISDWSNLTDVSFVLESWNVSEKSGVILIDEVCFSS